MAAADYRLMTEATGQRIAIALENLAGFGDYLTTADVVNDLTSGGTTVPLSAEMGKSLNGIAKIGPELCTWGTYNAVGTKITLNANYKNYRFLTFITGYTNASEVSVTTCLPVSNINYKGGLITIDCSNTSSSGKYMNLKFNSDTEVEIMAVSSGFAVSNALRMIIGLE